MQSLNAQCVGLAVPLILVGLISCTPTSPSAKISADVQTVQYTDKITSIATVIQSPNVNSIVYLKGRVGNQAPLLGGVVYELQDATGSIWVLTRETAPGQGDEVMVKGILQYQSIRLNGKEQGTAYVEQQQQLQHTPAIKS